MWPWASRGPHVLAELTSAQIAAQHVLYDMMVLLRQQVEQARAEAARSCSMVGSCTALLEMSQVVGAHDSRSDAESGERHG